MKQRQLKVSLPDSLRRQLDAAAKKSGESVAEEIRRRVEQSFAQEAADRVSRDFLERVAAMPAAIELEMGSAWHKDASAHFVFGETILNWLERFKPKGPLATPTDADRPHATLMLAGPKEDAKSILEALGRGIEFQLFRYGSGFSKSEMRQGLVEGRRSMIAAGFTRREVEGVKGRPFQEGFDEQEKLDLQRKLDQQRKRGKKS
jgi:Arc-like DNA binding dprotein